MTASYVNQHLNLGEEGLSHLAVRLSDAAADSSNQGFITDNGNDDIRYRHATDVTVQVATVGRDQVDPNITGR